MNLNLHLCILGTGLLFACSSSDEPGPAPAGTGGRATGGAAGSTTGGTSAGGGTNAGGGNAGGSDAGKDASTDSAAGGAPGVDARIYLPDAAPPMFDAAATTGEFLALTYNVAGLPQIFSSSPNALARMPLISELLNGYDLVLVQEDWLTPTPNPGAPNRGYHEILEDKVTHRYRSIPMPIPYGTDPLRPSALLSDGLNEFSRLYFNMYTTEHVRWKECFGGLTTGASDCLALKGFTRTVHKLAEGVEVDVYNLHGEAGSDPEDVPLQKQDFETELADYINTHSAGRAVILGGDTNLHTNSAPDDGVWQTFRTATGLKDVCETVACGSDEYQIDKFAYRSSSTVVIEPLTHKFDKTKFSYDGGALSDHDALEVRFRWSRGD
jgi:hypothetical protein